MRKSGSARVFWSWDRGQASAEYLGVLGIVVSLVLGLTFTSVGTDVAVGLRDAVCRILGGTCASDPGSGSGGDTALPGPGPSGRTVSPGPDGEGGIPEFDDASFEPDRCVLATETDKEKTVMRILFIKISSSSELKVTQWSDGSVTLDSTGTVQGGVEGGIDFPGLKQWGGSASLSGSYTKGGGGGGRWLFDSHRSGDPQKDLEANYGAAKEFAEYLKGAAKCNSGPPRAWGTELGMICHNGNKDKLPELEPEKQPDLDITKTTDEKSGDVKFGKKLTKGKDNKSVGQLTGKGAQGTWMNDTLVMRGNGEITFVYTMEINGRVGNGYQGEGSHMQQFYVTYNAEDYDREEGEGREHRPTKLRITTAERGMSGNPGVDVRGSVPAGPFTFHVEGGGGKTDTEVHTEVAELDLKDPKDSETVENYLRNGEDGDDSGIKQIHNAGIPSPHSASQPLAPDATSFERLLHDKGKLSSLDYKVNIDWWKAGFALSLGTSLHKWSTGFKLFGLETSHEHEEQKLIGDPTYAGAPRADGERPWLPFKKCSAVTPV
ncbi:hypothetical protein ACFV0C_15640 [Streptomyces sp. NPDC059568]|uniref:hypothetical protein n=1 Tax=Streptomyces sp. NPDC059568 TaxID=3346868 RepID=UPI0036C0F1E4